MLVLCAMHASKLDDNKRICVRELAVVCLDGENRIWAEFGAKIRPVCTEKEKGAHQALDWQTAMMVMKNLINKRDQLVWPNDDQIKDFKKACQINLPISKMSCTLADVVTDNSVPVEVSQAAWDIVRAMHQVILDAKAAEKIT